METIMRDKITFFRISSKICLFVLIFSLLWVFPLAATVSAAPPEVVPADRHDESPPMSVVPFLPPQAAFRAIPLRPVPHPAAPAATDPVLQGSAGSPVATNTPTDILGVGSGFSGPDGYFSVSSIPPDTNGAVGATQYVQWVNTSFAVFDKDTGDVQWGPVPGNQLWSGFGGPCETNNSGDPIAQYDKAANRWIMLQPVFKNPYALCVAVSTTDDATGQYYRYQFSVPGRYFPDYPKLGVWPDGYYVTYNQFKGGLFLGAEACAMDRSAMLSGGAATMQCYNAGSSYGSLLPADLDGSTPPPTGSPEYLLNFGTNSLHLWKFHVDFATPGSSTFTGPTSIGGVAPFNMACGGGTCIPQAGTNQKLDSLGDRLMYRLAYRNFGDHAAMVVNHSVDTGNGYTGIRWYELRRANTSGASFSVYQQGTYAPDSKYRWMGSIAMDQSGDIALGYSVSGNNISPQIRFTGRPSDTTLPLGDMEGETTIVNYGGSQTNYTRWGDYSSMTVDPTDDCTFWYTNEYQPVTGYYWSTRIAHFTFDNCSGTVVPPSTYSISGTVTASTGGGLGGVTMTLTGTSSTTTTTAGDGTYSFSSFPDSSTYTVTPSLSGYTFQPSSSSGSISGSNVTLDFTGTANTTTTYSISGTVTSSTGGALAGVTITLTGSSSGTTTTDGSGNYSFSGLADGGSYTVTPSMTGYSFAPSSQSINISGSDVTGIDFTGTAVPPTYSISGTVTSGNKGIGGVTMTLTSGSTVIASTNTNGGSGAYSFTGVASGSYTVTPSKNRYTFNPSSQAVSITSSDATNVNFTGSR